MKLFVVSDIHGYWSIMKNALDEAGFDPENPEHFLICCGDYFDRGTENVQVLKYFERLPRKVLLRGNHEDMLAKLLLTGQVLSHHYINGTLQTLNNFFGCHFLDPQTDRIDFSGKTRTVDRILDFIDGTVDYFETENYVFVHGWLPKGDYKTADTQAWADARWIKWTQAYDGNRPLPDKTLVCGHMPTFLAGSHAPERADDDAGIFYGNGLIAIDAGTRDSGRVNVLVLEESL